MICKGLDINGKKMSEGDTIRVFWPQTPCFGKDEVYDIVEKHKIVYSQLYKGLVITRKGQIYLVDSLTLEGNKPEIIKRSK